MIQELEPTEPMKKERVEEITGKDLEFESDKIGGPGTKGQSWLDDDGNRYVSMRDYNDRRWVVRFVGFNITGHEIEDKDETWTDHKTGPHTPHDVDDDIVDTIEDWYFLNKCEKILNAIPRRDLDSGFYVTVDIDDSNRGKSYSGEIERDRIWQNY